MSTPVQRYFDAFNAGDLEAMLAEITEDVEHYVNEGEVRVGKDVFRDFCTHMNRCYREELTDMVLFQSGDRAAAEYIVEGTYLATDAGLPEARGQTYRLPAASFFALRGGRLARVTTYYNLSEWIRQIS
ncbi:MAG: ketosteroid isomerase-related protein [Pseudomonadota bacterium]